MKRISVNLCISPCSQVQKRCEQKSLGGTCKVSCRGLPGENWGDVKLISTACAWEVKAEHEERATVSLVYILGRWLVACNYEIVADETGGRKNGREARTVLEPDSHGN